VFDGARRRSKQTWIILLEKAVYALNLLFGGEIKLVAEIIVDILKLLEPKQPVRAKLAA
jgi:hypothetical protein